MNRAAVISFGMVLAVLPSLASAKIQLRGEAKSITAPGTYTMAIFAEPTDNENEQLAVYDLGFLLGSVGGAPVDNVRFVPPYASRPAEGFVYGAGAATYNVPTTVSPPPGPRNFLLNVEAGTGTPLVDIVGPVKLAEVVFEVTAAALTTPGAQYRVTFDPNLVSISSGDPSRLDTNIEYTVSTAPDAGLITIVPEPASLSLLALGGLLALRRRRVA